MHKARYSVWKDVKYSHKMLSLLQPWAMFKSFPDRGYDSNIVVKGLDLLCTLIRDKDLYDMVTV